MNTYNYHLYQKRKSENLSIGKMAKAIGMSSFYYRLIENGYLKPGKKTVAKISEYLGEDYAPYLEGAASNPCDLPEKKPFRIVAFFYQLMANWITRGVLIFLALCSLGVFISSFIVNDHMDSHYRDYYDPELCLFADEVRNNGTITLSLVDDLTVPMIYEVSEDPNTGRDKFISITGHYANGQEFSITFRGVYRSDTYRFSAMLYSNPRSTMGFYCSMTITNLETAKRNFAYFEYDENMVPKDLIGAASTDGYSELANKCASSIIEDINRVIRENTSSTLTYQEISKLQAKHADAVLGITMYVAIAQLLGMVLSAVLVFAVVFAFLYGVKKNAVSMPFARTNFEVDEAPEPPLKPLKKDIRFAPFIPETVLEFVGIILVFFGSLRLSVYVGGFFGITSLGTAMANSSAQEFMGTFMLGMFLLYFLDFDIFLEDRRVARNIFLYALVFFCLYYLEISLLSVIESGGIVLGTISEFIVIPNMFGSISCYFMIMFFLFFTPKKLKKRYQLIIFRCLAIIPIAYITVAWILFHGNGVWFNLGWSREVLYLFNGERLPFSVLAVSYLVGYYFIRLFFEKRYGKENAQAFFNSNRFLWIKNGFVALIIGAVALVELLLSNNPTALKLDIGHYSNLVILIPMLLFYHPHKGPRNKAVDWTTLGFYILALVLAYTIIVIIGLLGFASNLLG